MLLFLVNPYFIFLKINNRIKHSDAQNQVNDSRTDLRSRMHTDDGDAAAANRNSKRGSYKINSCKSFELREKFNRYGASSNSRGPSQTHNSNAAPNSYVVTAAAAAAAAAAANAASNAHILGQIAKSNSGQLQTH